MRNVLEVMRGMSDLIPHFPTVLDEPRIYLSTAQADICRRNPVLSHLVLPGWAIYGQKRPVGGIVRNDDGGHEALLRHHASNGFAQGGFVAMAPGLSE
jgi:hypothetical protein